MCFTNEGKYFVRGKEIKIDLENIDELPIEVLKTLEGCNMTQLDALYIRKRMHNISQVLDKLSNNLEDQKETALTRIEQIESKLYILEEAVESLEKIASVLEDMQMKQDERETERFQTLITKIDYVANKTIFGWIKNQYESNALRTIIWMGLLFVFGFILTMRIFDIESFKDLFQYIKNWFL